MENGILLSVDLPDLTYEIVKLHLPCSVSENGNLMFEINIDTDRKQELLMQLLIEASINKSENQTLIEALSS